MGQTKMGENRMTIKPKKVFEREDGYTEYEVKVAGKYYSIERWQGMFSVGEWYEGPRNEFKSLDAAIAAIRAETPKIKILGATNV
jgi:hypothetical protein